MIVTFSWYVIDDKNTPSFSLIALLNFWSELKKKEVLVLIELLFFMAVTIRIGSLMLLVLGSNFLYSFKKREDNFFS